MKKPLSVRPLPDRKNSFSIWVDKIRSNDQHLKLPKKPVIKSVYIRKSDKILNKNHKNWNDIPENSKDKYLEKIHLMEEIRQRKMENRIVDLLYSSRNACPASSESK